MRTRGTDSLLPFAGWRANLRKREHEFQRARASTLSRPAREHIRHVTFVHLWRVPSQAVDAARCQGLLHEIVTAWQLRRRESAPKC